MNDQVSKYIRGKMTNKSSTENIVADVAIKFAEWMFTICENYNRGETYTISKTNCEILNLNPDWTYSSQELFEIFINKYYETT